MSKMVFLGQILCIIVICDLNVISAGVLKNNDDAQYDEEPFPVSIIHINDMHARFDETNNISSACKDGEKCIGGYARAVTIIKKLMAKHQHQHTNPIYLNAGDSFQGSPWYTFGRWNVTSEMFNLLNADAITLGNHDFYDGISGLIPFLETLQTNVIVANIDDSNEPKLQNKYNKSIVIDRFERKIGIIGILLRDVDKIADTGKLRFIDETIAIQNEAIELKRQGVDIIIVLSHCGLTADYEIAKKVGSYIDVIVGGHSHTFMFTETETTNATGPDKIDDNYPAVVEFDNGHRVLIVQASAFMKYVGDLTIFFDKTGEIIGWKGAPVFLENNIVPDPDVLIAMKPWKKMINENVQKTLAKTEIPLLKVPCHSRECHLGNLLSDAFVDHYRRDMNTHSDYNKTTLIGMITSATIHSSRNAGETITLNDLLMILPFENSLDLFELRGDHLKELFEHSVSESWNPDTFVGKWLMQISGARVTYNMSRPVNDRVISIDILNHKTSVYWPINSNEYYLCAAQKFLANGGDGYEMIKKYKRNLHNGPNDVDVVSNYLLNLKVIRHPKPEHRITFLNVDSSYY